VLRSTVISKNRYGQANRVICSAFWGSVGWFKELPEPDKNTDFTQYISEQDNIPCRTCVKIDKEIKDDPSIDKDTGEIKQITYSF
jgi:hypothetical protein